MNEKTETVYSVKYALTTGIVKVTGYEMANGWFMSKKNHDFHCLRKSQWTRDVGVAIDLAIKLRDKKLASLAKQGRKLAEMTFELP